MSEHTHKNLLVPTLSVNCKPIAGIYQLRIYQLNTITRQMVHTTTINLLQLYDELAICYLSLRARHDMYPFRGHRASTLQHAKTVSERRKIFGMGNATALAQQRDDGWST